MKWNTGGLILLSFFGFTSVTFAQNSIVKHSWLSKHPLEIGMGSNNVRLPFHSFMKTPFYCQINAGLQFNLTPQGRFQLNQYLGLGVALHPYNGNRFFVDTSFRLRYNSPIKTYVQVGIIAAFVIHDYPHDVFILNGNGGYERASRYQARKELLGGLSLELGHPFPFFDKGQFDVYFKYSFTVAGPNHPEIPVLPYTSLQLGCRIYFLRDKK